MRRPTKAMPDLRGRWRCWLRPTGWQAADDPDAEWARHYAKHHAGERAE